MINKEIQIEINRNKYKDYIENHITNVQNCYEEFKNIFKDQDFCTEPELLQKLDANIKMHDISKYSEEEFEPYRINFNPISEEEKEKNKTKFDIAWLHHYTVNPHHWNHWYDEASNTCRQMPSIYLAEMIVDWMAMGVKFGNSAYEYYHKNKQNIHLNEQTRFRLEYLLERLNKEEG